MSIVKSRGGLACALFLVCLAVYLPTAARTTTHLDVDHAAVAAWRITETGTPWLDDVDIEEFGEEHDFDPKFIVPAENGHVVVKRSPGVIAAGLPAYWVASHERFSAGPQATWAAILTSLSMALLFLGLARHLPVGRSAGCTLVVAFATPVWTVPANGLWAHTVTVLGIAGMIWAAGRGRWLLLGAAGGLALWGRTHMALVVAIVGLGLALSRRQPMLAGRVGLTSGIALGLASVWSHWMYGSWSPTGGYDAESLADRVATGDNQTVWGQVTNQLGMWIAPDRGVLVWTPLLVLLAPAVVRSWKRLPDWSRWLLLGGAAYTVLQAWFSPFYGGDGLYGYRLGLEFLLCAVPAYAFSLPQAGAVARKLLGPVIAAQFAMISLGAMVDRLALGENTAWTHHVFVWAAIRAPVLWIWLAIMLVIGALVQRVVEDRSRRRTEPISVA